MRKSVYLSALALLLAVVGLASLLCGLRPALAQGPSPAATPSLIWPLSGSATPDTDQISSPFGPRWQASQGRFDYHPGIDIAAPIGTPIYAVAAGQVTKVYWPSASSGLTVLISHTLGFYSAYLHLSAAVVTGTQQVTQGLLIGYVGDSGITDFAHLHFEIRLPESVAGKYPATTRNPLGYLPHPDVTTPTIAVTDIISDPIYSPAVTLTITAPRDELDVNRIRVYLVDRATGEKVDDQFVDFNQRLHTGSDGLDQDGIRLVPSAFSTRTLEYRLAAGFYNLHALDSFTLTAEVTDLAGHTGTISGAVDDTTPPERITTLRAWRRPGGRVGLTWRAPGDSGAVGRAAAYEVYYDTQPIDDSSLVHLAPLADSPAPLPAGETHVWLAPGPFPEPAYFALRARDDEGNWSPVSNAALATGMAFLPLVAR